MRPLTRVPEPLTMLASSQGGLVTTAQALEAGLTHRSLEGLLRRGTWTRVATGVLATRHSDMGWNDLAWAGVLIGGPGASLGGAAAAHVHGFGPRVLPIDVWIPGGSRAGHPVHADGGDDRWRFRRGQRRGFGSPPRISVAETVLDLCAGKNADEQSRWLGEVLRDRRTTLARLDEALAQAPRLKGRRQLAELLQVVAGGSHSPLEVRYLRDVERAHGLPKGVRQKSVSRSTRSDVVYEEYATIVELDGELGHRGPAERHDAWRDARHLGQGFGTLRFGWADMVHRCCEAAVAVGTVLQRNGWSGEPKACRYCR